MVDVLGHILVSNVGLANGNATGKDHNGSFGRILLLGHVFGVLFGLLILVLLERDLRFIIAKNDSDICSYSQAD